MGSGIVHVRISTAILLLALLGFPYAALWIPAPHIFPGGGKGEEIVNWIFYDFTGGLFGVALVAAVITIVVLAVEKKWRSVPQHILEIVICLMAAVYLPAYGHV